jgi:hypothetical protein
MTLRIVPLVALVLPALVLCCSSPSSPPGAPTDPSELSAPAAGQGFQFGTPVFTIPAGVEEQDCYFFKVSDLAQSGGLDPTQPVELHRVQVVQKPGSHHMNIFRVRTIVGLDPANGLVQKAQNGVGACFVSSNWSDWPLVANTQINGNLDWTYPDGVANELDPDEMLMLQTHYVNAQTQTTPGNVGQVSVNFTVLATADVKQQMGTLFATDQSIRICESNPTPSFSESCQLNSTVPVTIIGANGHFHSRGTKFDMFAWDGKSTTPPDPSAEFYESLTWADPPMLHSPDLAVTIPPGGGVWYTCDYQWEPPDPSIGCAGLNSFDETKHMTPAAALDCCYTFGPQVDKNEHCNAFVYYYPKQQGDVNCF